VLDEERDVPPGLTEETPKVVDGAEAPSHRLTLSQAQTRHERPVGTVGIRFLALVELWIEPDIGSCHDNDLPSSRGGPGPELGTTARPRLPASYQQRFALLLIGEAVIDPSTRPTLPPGVPVTRSPMRVIQRPVLLAPLTPSLDTGEAAVRMEPAEESMVGEKDDLLAASLTDARP
jgi:hypothetical protein